MWGLLLLPIDLGRPGKTGQFDESIVPDNLSGLDVLFRLLLSDSRDATTLWPHTPEQFIAMWNQVVVELQLQPLNPCRYALRHGGAWEDVLCHRRLLVDVKRRGRWVSDTASTVTTRRPAFSASSSRSIPMF